ncbi:MULTISPECIES: hypothetical protein [unclassified Enterococcus]|uniref:hypothetical protein n=1 Tax=unclassified Enterococcus TaxID=2608891 RepID=UPI0028FD324F|nr:MULTISPECIES: hypothetical protein [unclassified Enterococcus]MDU0320671.1 hypothetical protein [Enterococcus sp. 2STP]MDU0333956.1 hypothetical protein [Enterococcus sp. 2CBP]MDU0350393.1 hypothetical protein [Enterococcus sp. 3MOLP]
MMNGAYGRLLDGPRQTITTYDEGAVFTLNSGARLGASQIKNTPYLGQFKISFDIKPMELMSGESQAELTLGNVYPGG